MRTRRRGRGEQPQGLIWLRCSECGATLLPAGVLGDYLACPYGHGRLMLDAGRADEGPPGEACGSLFDTGPGE